MTKIKCKKCNKKPSVWFYAPSSKDENAFYCDDCVPRGCSCNVYNIDEFSLYELSDRNYIFWNKDMTYYTKEKDIDSVYFEQLDEQGRRFPCCEYWYDEDGWDEDDFIE